MSAKPTLIIGSKNYSSWSLRPWLVLRQFGVAFEEVKLPLDTPEFYRRIRDYSPSGRVPVLIVDDLHVWDSLAIIEYANEQFLDNAGWPKDRVARAVARSISAEMHSGFSALRTAMPMNCRKRVPGFKIGDDAAKDVERVIAMWREMRERFGRDGSFLFGDFSIADAMYAPVVFRFVSYGVKLESVERAYVDAVLALPAIVEWLADAGTEPMAALHEQLTP
ncbi:MAG: glutathione S-transferase family protein [Rudaea sp.]